MLFVTDSEVWANGDKVVAQFAKENPELYAEYERYHQGKSLLSVLEEQPTKQEIYPEVRRFIEVFSQIDQALHNNQQIPSTLHIELRNIVKTLNG